MERQLQNTPVTPPAIEPRAAHAAQSQVALLLPVPDNLVEFTRVYATDEACRQALVHARWPNGFVCPKCGHPRGYDLEKYPVIECVRCGHQASATAGTLLHGTKLPLSKLFLLLYLIVAEKDGANAKQLERQAGVNYKTARLWKLKVSDLLHCREKDKLAGRGEIDETIVGGGDEYSIGRRLSAKQRYVMVMVEDRGKECGRLRLEAADDVLGETLTTVVGSKVKEGATAHTDGLHGYAGIEDYKIAHKPQVVGDPAQASKKLPWVHRVASLLKRVILGTLQGSISMGWLPWLLAEFEFRFNRRKANKRPLLFARLMEFGLKRAAQTRSYFLKKGEMFRQMGLS